MKYPVSQILKFKAVLFFIIPVLFIFFLIACEKDDTQNIEIPDYIPEDKEEFITEDKDEPTTVTFTEIDENTGQEKQLQKKCTITHVSLSENPAEFAGYDEFAGVLRPGILVKGSSVLKGVPIEIPIADYRKNIRVTLNIVSGGSGTFFREVRPVGSEIINAMNEILREYDGTSAANYEYESELITSKSHLEAKLKVGWSNPCNNLSVKTNFNYDDSKSSVLVTLKQAFFTFSVDPLSEFNTFVDNKIPSEINSYIKPETDGTPNPLAYIHSVTYGRVYRLLYTSSAKNFDLKASVDYAYKGLINKVSAQAEAAYETRMAQYNVQVYQFGGDPEAGLATAFINDPTDLDTVREFIVKGANFSKTNVGQPISFVVKNLKDGSTISVNNTLTYDRKEYSDINIPENTDSTKVFDIDGNVYPVVIIGNQRWMGENLRTTRLNNGKSILNISIGTKFVETDEAAYCGHLQTNKGRLYNWYTVETEKLCPSGWHVPSEGEWVTLINYLDRWETVAPKLKGSGTTYWGPGNNGTNESGFNALPGGMIWENGDEHRPNEIAIWWTTTAGGDRMAGRWMENRSNFLRRDDYPKKDGLSVRCLKDE